MQKLTRESLHALQEKLANEIKIRKTGHKKAYITVNIGNEGLENGSKSVFNEICKTVDAENLRGDVVVTQVARDGLREANTVVEVLVHGTKAVRYGHITVENASRIIKEHVLNGKVLEDLILKF
ncbi:MAG: hypothetical protein IJU92_05815 [Spirochaetaceae bacterium]|nr:hypothetical protein [Spirochaetaceae bacterium]